MCVYGMLHGTLAVLRRYLNVAFHRHYDYIHRGREGGREMREFDSVMMTVSPFHFSLFLSHLYHLVSN